ncbi:MAG: lysyl-tRNA synthetase [Candidatus Magasanikbacteria bacterium GW2011_GWC2_37_14]|uniref:Lysine--tRNA ligase n=1 Tax=Candidatus Magasanikbacteria bacterium GW2011_GWC2_37_14 TaxID=1619046 RepID=A0A0G0IVE8_9BACT|nr:MAG: lysyl-tRNA synthetase [Candidatus Magasanikbacteria bacterium GW2011_GWC2_37_14]
MEKITNINDEKTIRIGKLNDLKKLGVNPYPAKAHKKNTLEEALSMTDGEKVCCAGRIITFREMGKLTFCHLQDASAKMQIALKDGEIDKESYHLFLKKIDSGDIIQVEGERFTTHKGEASILVKKWTLLSKSLLPLPDKFHGLQDEEIRLRKRYLEMIDNPEVKDIFIRKSKFWNSTRQFLLKEGFLEVETPALEVTAGGASATPFVTHHNALDIDVYLRISMGELWQKRLMVAGFEKTFEIGRQFRNEGMSREHLQDYTQMEFYWAYADYNMGMELVEKLIKYIAKETYNTLKFTIGDFGEIDLGEKWERYDYVSIIKEKTGVDVLKTNDKELKIELKKLKVAYEETEGRSSLIDALWKFCRRSLKGPGFLINVPVAVSPLAKRKTDNPELTERFQIIIAGSELGNGYSELNDPIDQAERFKEQASMREAGDNEAQMHDTDFVEALEHGMPPTCGFGFSERLFSFLENKPIRECVIFPLMRPEKGDLEKISVVSKKNNDVLLKLPITREEALCAIKKYTKKPANLNHYLESEVVMRALATHLKQNVEYWGMLGLLHDIDWEMTEDDSIKHLTKAPELLKGLGFDDYFIEIILSHGYGCNCAGLNDKKRSKQLEFALACAETVTGLIYSVSLMRPDKIATLDAKSVMKKFKDKKFAAKVDREVIKECEKIGLGVEEFLQLSIEAIRSIAGQIGLK